MTHKDIYTKFMIEYDKANVTSSYPSLTEYEVATLLDKAYLALIAQKVTGNNPRRVPFESDVKAIADIQPLVTHKDLLLCSDGHEPAANITQFNLPEDCLYIVSTMLNCRLNATDSNDGRLKEVEVYAPEDIGFEKFDNDPLNIWVSHNETYSGDTSTDWVMRNLVYGDNNEYPETSNTTIGNLLASGNPYDNELYRYSPVRLVTHDIAEKFFLTPYNMPWVKIPVSYVESNMVKIVYDPIMKPNVESNAGVHFTYIRRPLSFVTELEEVTVKPDPNPIIDPVNNYFTLDVSALSGGDILK